MSKLAGATSDHVLPLQKIEMSFSDFRDKDAKVALLCDRRTRQVVSMTVDCRGKSVVIPEEELAGISDIQINSLHLKIGAYYDGKMYHYVEALFGEPLKRSKDGFRKVWFMIHEEYVERKVFIYVQIGPKSFRLTPLSKKERGKPETKSEQSSAWRQLSLERREAARN